MARPKQPERRDQQFNIKLTQLELELVRTQAARAGMRPIDYGRAKLLGEQAVATATSPNRPHLDPLFLCELSRLGNNLNQLTRKLNSFPQPAPPTLEPLLQEIRAMIARAPRR